MKITIPEHLKGKDLFKFLVENKSALIRQKKAILKKAEPIVFSTLFVNSSGHLGNKAAGETVKDADTGVIRVKVVANTSLWCDSQMDVLLRDNAKKSIKERLGMIEHIHDHIWEVGSILGDVVNIYYEDVPLKDLGIDKPGKAQCLVFETDIRKDYNEKIYNLYKTGKIKQHSIGLFYVSLELAINDPDYEKEIDFWNKYYDQVINKDVVDETGYFWVVSEIKLMENSAVLFGSNILTPTLEVDGESQKSTSTQPPLGTEEKPQEKQEGSKPIDVDWSKIADRLTF